MGERYLPPDHRAILDFEDRWPGNPAGKVQAIRTTFEIPALVYYDRLNTVIDHPAAFLYAPLLVRRLWTQREERRRLRTMRRLGVTPSPTWGGWSG